eukprot:g22420.t1
MIDLKRLVFRLDPEHVKALHRRSQAFEKIHSYAAALLDLRELRRLGGLSKEMLDARSAELEKKQAAVEQVAREAAEDKADDPIGMAMTNVKDNQCL